MYIYIYHTNGGTAGTVHHIYIVCSRMELVKGRTSLLRKLRNKVIRFAQENCSCREDEMTTRKSQTRNTNCS